MKKLYRSKNDAMMAGVCAGIAEALDWDPTIIRLIVTAIAIFTAIVPALIIYLIAAIVIPKDTGYIDV